MIKNYPAKFYNLEGEKIRCKLCPHECKIGKLASKNPF